jgi:hypothetical protein
MRQRPGLVVIPSDDPFGRPSAPAAPPDHAMRNNAVQQCDRLTAARFSTHTSSA